MTTALVITPHPMTTQGQTLLDAEGAALVPGEMLASFLARHGVEPGQQWRVALGGVDVPEAHWHRVRPKHGHLVEARRVPEKSVLRLVAVAALGYFTFGAGGLGAGGLFAAGGAIGGGWLAAGAAYLAGSVVINKLLGPKPIKTSQNTALPTYSISGGRNQARAWEPVGLVLGEPYMVPDLAAQPFTYFAGGEQFLWQLFNCGINCAAVNTVRIGQTAIGEYQGVTLGYEGFSSGNTGLPNLGTTSVDSVAGAVLDAPTSPGAWVVRTSSVGTVQLAVDIEGQLFAVSDKGAYQNASCNIEIEYRAVGSGTWLKFGADASYTIEHPAVYTTETVDSGPDQTTTFMVLVTPAWTETITPTVITLNNASTKPLRVTFQRWVAAGQYEVRARKVSVNTTTPTAQNVLQWTVLRSFQVDTGDYAGQSRLGVQIQASGQLNGAVDELNMRAVAKAMAYWNGSAWVTATGRANGLCNPGALILLLARGIYNGAGKLLAGLGWADAQIDIEGLKGFMVWCASKGFTFDLFLQEAISIWDLLQSIAAAGLGSISFHPGTLSVIWFSDTDPVESVLNMGAMKARSFSVDYDTQNTADEIEAQYFDRNRGDTWRSVRVLAPGVSVPTTTARMRLDGVTTEAQAAVLARFAMAQNIYQRKSINCEVDLEHMTFRRGTVMAISHDLTQWGYGGRLREVSNTAGILTLTLDDLVPELSPSGGSTRYIGLRLAGEAQYRIFGCTTVYRNLLQFSSYDASRWTDPGSSGITFTPGQAGPYGAMTAVRCDFSTASGSARILRIGVGSSLSTTGSYRLSFWMRWVSGTLPVMAADINDLPGGINYTAQLVLGQWVRVTGATCTLSSGAITFVDVVGNNGGSMVLDVDGVQLEAGAVDTELQQKPGPTRTVKLSSAWPGGVAVPGASVGNPAHDTLWIYDFKATPGQKVRVAEVSPTGNLEGARVVMVPESAEFWTYVWTGAYQAPPNNSLLPAAPEISNAVVTEALRRQGATYYTELTISFRAAGAYDRAELWGAVGDGVSNGPLRQLGSTRGLSVQWQGGLQELWALELRPFSSLHAGEPVRLGYKVAGLAVSPPPFDFFLVKAQPDGTRQYNFGYSNDLRKPVDWLGAEIRYVSGAVPSPDWATMTRLQDTTTFYTSSPVEINAPLSGTYTFACRSLDTSGNESTSLVQTIALPQRRLGNVFEEHYEHMEGWPGTKTGCHIQEGVLEANDSTTWATAPATWTLFTRWNYAPTSPIRYETPVRDFGVIVAGQIDSAVEAEGSVTVELSTSPDGVTWSAWGSAAPAFVSRYLKLRVSVASTAPAPVPVIRSWGYVVTSKLKRETVNDVVISGLAGPYRIGVGDVRVPLSGSFSAISYALATVQDSTAGVWAVTRIDKSTSPGPRFQFRLNGTLADPAFVDFDVEGL